MTDRKLTEAEMITYLQLSVELGNTARLAPEEAQRLLDLIDGKTATNEAICEIMGEQRAEIDRLRSEVKEKTETIDFLKDQAVGWSIDFCNLKAKLNTAKSEAIKEFANRLKVKVGSIPPYHFNLLQVKEDIDNLVKEMTEGENGL